MSQLLELEPVFVRRLCPDPEDGPPRSNGRSSPSRDSTRASRFGPTTPDSVDPVLTSPLSRRTPDLRTGIAWGEVLPRVGRVTGIAVLATLGLLCAGRASDLASRPVRETYRIGSEIRSLEHQLALEAAINKRLQEDIAYARSQAGIEQEARKRGWVLPGEVALTITAHEPAGPVSHPVADAAEPAAARRAVTWIERLRDGVDTCLAVFGPRAR